MVQLFFTAKEELATLMSGELSQVVLNLVDRFSVTKTEQSISLVILVTLTSSVRLEDLSERCAIKSPNIMASSIFSSGLIDDTYFEESLSAGESKL